MRTFNKTHFKSSMPIKTLIHGEDASSEETITSMQQNLTQIGFNIVEQSWLNPITNVWTVRIQDNECALLFTHGKGTSKKSALASGLGAFFERLSSHYFWVNVYLGDEISNSKFVYYANEKWFQPPENGDWPKDVLNDSLHRFYDPENEIAFYKLIDANSANHHRGVCCLPFTCQRTQSLVYFPVNIIANLYASNGIAVGKTKSEARVLALSEIIENFVKFKVIAEDLSLPNIPTEVLDRYPNIQQIFDALEEAGFSVLLHDASLEGKYPVVAITLIDPTNQGVLLSFGSHPIFETALESSVTALLQNRNLDALDCFAEIGFDLDEIASPKNLQAHFKNSNGIISWNFFHQKSDFEFTDWDQQQSKNDTQNQFLDLCDLIQSHGNDIYIADYEELGVHCCRILVPGMSEVFPIDDLMWENNNAGNQIRNAILKQNKTAEECKHLIHALEDLNCDDHYLVAALIGMHADEDSIFADLRITELVTLLALKIQDNERIQEGCEWLIHFKQINAKRLKTYQCINTLLQLDGMVNYGEALKKLYGAETLNNALALIDGEDVFPLKSNWVMHKLLLDGYKKVILGSSE